MSLAHNEPKWVALHSIQMLTLSMQHKWKIIIDIVCKTIIGDNLPTERPTELKDNLGRVTPTYINAYMCAQDLFMGGAIYLAKNIVRYGIFQNKGRCL